MQAARKSERVRSFLRAQIIFNQHMSTIDCVVKNISATGARLALDDSLSIPEEFDLHIPQKGKTYRARLAWRTSDSLGIEFVTESAQHSSEPQASAESLEAKLRNLELQNAELKAQVRALTKRLRDLGQDPNIAA